MNARVAIQLIALSALIAAAVADDTAEWITVPSSGTPHICFANVSHDVLLCENDREILVDCGSLDNGRHAFELFLVASGFPGMHELDDINVMLQWSLGPSAHRTFVGNASQPIRRASDRESHVRTRPVQFHVELGEGSFVLHVTAASGARSISSRIMLHFTDSCGEAAFEAKQAAENAPTIALPPLSRTSPVAQSYSTADCDALVSPIESVDPPGVPP